MSARFSQWRDRVARARVLVVGDVMLDEYLTGDCSRISPEAPVPVVSVTASRAVLGGAANTAANITSLGGRAVLVGLVGDDGPGRQLGLSAENAGIEFVPVTDGRPTVRKVRIVGQQQQLLRLDYETPAPVAADAESRMFDAAVAQLASCSIVVMSD